MWSYLTHALLYTINEDYQPVRILHMKCKNFLVFGLVGSEKEGKIMIWNINDKEHA